MPITQVRGIIAIKPPTIWERAHEITKPPASAGRRFQAALSDYDGDANVSQPRPAERIDVSAR
jgi:hypothetical protein